MRLLSGTEIKIVILQKKKINKNEPEEGDSNDLKSYLVYEQSENGNEESVLG